MGKKFLSLNLTNPTNFMMVCQQSKGKGGHGFIDTKGILVIPHQYTFAWIFRDNICDNYSILKSFVNDTDIDLLTIPYRKAINGIGTAVANIPNVAFADNYGTNKGIWLNRQLNDLKCVHAGK